MPKKYRIELEANDLGQALDGLECRAKSWEKTAQYLRTQEMPAGELFLIEECSDPEEAEQIAAHYRSIIEMIGEQMKEQSDEHTAG
jgi:L-serine deaminase